MRRAWNSPSWATNSFIVSVRLARHCAAVLSARSTPTSRNSSDSCMVVRQVVERRHDQTLGQVAGGAEDHHRAGRRHRGARDSCSLASASARRSGLSSIVVAFCCVAAGFARLIAASVASEQLHRHRDDPLGLEAELALQFLERRRGAEGLHADDAAGGTDIAVPAQHRSLLDGDARLHRRAAAPRRDRTAAGARKCPRTASRRRASESPAPPAFHGPRTTKATSLPEAIRMISGGPPGASAMT